MTLRLRDLTDDERTEVQRITRSHTLGAAFVRRAQIVAHAMSGLKAEEIASRMDLCGNTVRYWINRFNARGLDGLEEDVRTGRPPTYSAEQRSAVITAALTRPTELGLPFACWTLDRLVAYLSDHGPAGLGPGPDGWGPYHEAAMALASGVDLLVHDALPERSQRN